MNALKSGGGGDEGACLVAFEDTYRAYGDVIVRAIRNTYPRIEVVAVADEGLEAEVALFDPHLVITSRSSHPAPLASRRGRLSRLKLSVDRRRMLIRLVALDLVS